LLLGFVGCNSYNGLVGLEEGVDSAWAQVENAYQRRADLIPNLVETVKGARDFEQETFTQVAEARAGAGKMRFEGTPTAEQLRAFEQNQGALSSALSRLLVTVERYPELKATQAFRDLQVQLEGTENRISVERKRFNDAAQAFNTARRRIPTVVIANLMGLTPKPYFQAEAGADQPPAVDFGN
jgi:LemA protein